MFERECRSKNVVQHPLEPGPVRRLVDRVAEKGGESRPIQGPGLEKVGGFSLQAASSDQRFENGVAQLAEQGGLVPVPQRVIGAVGEPDAIGDENVLVDVGLEPRTKGLHRHDHPRSGFLALVSSVSVTSDLGGGPASKDSVDEPSYLAMQSGV